MRLPLFSLFLTAVLGANGCEGHSGQTRTAVPARPATTPPASTARIAKDHPPAAASSATPPPAKETSTIATCEEPCPNCTVLLESEGNAVVYRRLTATEKALLADLFHGYLLSADCLEDSEHVELADLAKRGRDLSQAKVVIDGSFTAPGRKQTLVTFFMGHCGVLGRHYENYGVTLLVLFEGGKIVMATEDGPSDALELLPIDFENDGVAELAAFSANYASGTTFSAVEIWSLNNGPKSLAHFEFSRRSCLGDPDYFEYFESSLLTRWDPQTNRRCLLQRRRDLECNPEPKVRGKTLPNKTLQR